MRGHKLISVWPCCWVKFQSSGMIKRYFCLLTLNNTRIWTTGDDKCWFCSRSLYLTLYNTDTLCRTDRHGLLNSFLWGSWLVFRTEKGFWAFLLYRLQCFHDILPSVHAIPAQELAFWQNRHLGMSSPGRELTSLSTEVWALKIAIVAIVEFFLKKEATKIHNFI